MPDESSRAVSTTTVNGGKHAGGRPRGALGHFTQESKDAIETTMRLLGDQIKGSDENKQGGVIGYLMYLAIDKPAVFAMMAAKARLPQPKIEINTEVNEVVYRSVHEIETTLKERGVPSLNVLAAMEAEEAEIIDVTPADDEVH